MSDNPIKNIIAKHYQDILNYCITRMYPDIDSASDCAQNAVLVLIRKAENIKSSENVLPWIYRITNNEIRNYKRKQEKEILIDSGTISDMVSDSPFDESILDVLEDEERKLVEAYYLGENKQKLADNLGITLEALYVRISRIKKKLAKELEENQKIKF